MEAQSGQRFGSQGIEMMEKELYRYWNALAEYQEGCKRFERSSLFSKVEKDEDDEG